MRLVFLLILIIPNLAWGKEGQDGNWTNVNPSSFTSGIKFDESFKPKVHKSLFLSDSIVEGREIDYKDEGYFISYGHYEIRQLYYAWSPSINFIRTKFIKYLNGESDWGYGNRQLFDNKISDYDLTEWTKAKNFKGVNAKGGKTFSFKLQLDKVFFCNVAEVYVENIYGPYPQKASYVLMCNKYGYLNENKMNDNSLHVACRSTSTTCTCTGSKKKKEVLVSIGSSFSL